MTIISRLRDYLVRADGMDPRYYEKVSLELARLVDDALEAKEAEALSELATLVDEAEADKEHKSKMDRAIAASHAPSGAAPIPPRAEDDNATYFLIVNNDGDTHVTEHTKEGLRNRMPARRKPIAGLSYSDTSEWGAAFLVIRGEIVVPRPVKHGVTAWEID